jgi:hypothetical protein
MPCRYYTEAEELANTTKELDQYARLLCHACQLLEAAGYAKRMGGELSAWWKDHQMQDKKRKAQERDARDLEFTREQARKKLSKKERKALGL